MIASALLLAFLSPLAEATDVFVAPFLAQDADAEAAAATALAAIARELGRMEGIQVLRREDVGDIHDLSSDVYFSSCPATELVGCAYVLGEAGGAAFAVAGTVEGLGQGARVEIHIIDVGAARESLSFQAEMGEGDDRAFAQGVSRVLLAVVGGEAGGVSDIRVGSASGEEDAPFDRERVSHELDQLSTEIGDVTSLDVRGSGHIERPRTTAADIAEKMEQEGVKPWERLEMGPSEYLRYQNSGMPLYEWRERSRGRQGQVVLRPYAGFGRAPVNQHYYGRYAQSGEAPFEVVEVYAWQQTEAGAGAVFGLMAGYGLLPFLEVGVLGGVAQGRFHIDPDKVTVGKAASEQEDVDTFNTTVQLGAYALVPLMPTSSIRPVLGARLAWWQGTSVASHLGLPAELPAFAEKPTFVTVGPIIGGEARISNRVDLYVQVPIDLMVAGGKAIEVHTGGGGLSNTVSPSPVPAVSASGLLGVQIKLGGRQGLAMRRAHEDEVDPDFR